MDKSHTPEKPHRGMLDPVFDMFTKKTTPAGQDQVMKHEGVKEKLKLRKNRIDDAVEKAGG